MASRLAALSIDASDPEALARFWADILGRPVGADGVSLLPDDDAAFPIRFVATGLPKVAQNWLHFDLTSTTPEDQQETVDRVLGLGGSHCDVGQRGDEGHVVLADPEGNEFCVIEADNNFLAGCGRVGALSGDGSQECGYFWGRALDWPLVWDQDEETAIQSPRGGTKITWGGPPYLEKTGKERWHLDLEVEGTDLADEAERLVALGATRVDIGQGNVSWVVMADPDGHEFCLRPHEPSEGPTSLR
jgi:hypothetical protein